MDEEIGGGRIKCVCECDESILLSWQHNHKEKEEYQSALYVDPALCQ